MSRLSLAFECQADFQHSKARAGKTAIYVDADNYGMSASGAQQILLDSLVAVLLCP